MPTHQTILLCITVAGLASACTNTPANTDTADPESQSSDGLPEDTGEAENTGEAESTGEAEDTGEAESACERYGGPAEVASVVADHIVPELLGDCRVSSMFTSLPEAAQTHLVECLTIQVQELFGCDGSTYAGSTDSMGAMCRDMVNAHTGLGITNGDFDAVIEDIVAGLVAAGIAQADIDAVAPTVLSTRAAIVEVESDQLSNSSCQGG